MRGGGGEEGKEEGALTLAAAAAAADATGDADCWSGVAAIYLYFHSLAFHAVFFVFFFSFVS